MSWASQLVYLDPNALQGRSGLLLSLQLERPAQLRLNIFMLTQLFFFLKRLLTWWSFDTLDWCSLILTIFLRLLRVVYNTNHQQEPPSFQMIRHGHPWLGWLWVAPMLENTYAYIYMHIHIYIYMHIYICMHVSIYIYIHMDVCIHMYIHAW